MTHPCGCPATAHVVDSHSHAAFHALAERQGIPPGPVNAATVRAARGLSRPGEQPPEPQGVTYVRHDAPPTSAAAASRAAPGAKTQAGRVLRCIVDAADEGATDEQVSERLGLALNTVRPRRLELVERGLVLDSGDTRPTATGSQATVWLATLDGITATERMST